MKPLALLVISLLFAACTNSPSGMTPRQLEANAYAARQGKLSNDIALLLRRGYTVSQIANQLHMTAAEVRQYTERAYTGEQSEAARRIMLEAQLMRPESPTPTIQQNNPDVAALNDRVEEAEQLAREANDKARLLEQDAQNKENERALNSPPPKRFDPWHR